MLTENGETFRRGQERKFKKRVSVKERTQEIVKRDGKCSEKMKERVEEMTTNWRYALGR